MMKPSFAYRLALLALVIGMICTPTTAAASIILGADGTLRFTGDGTVYSDTGMDGVRHLPGTPDNANTLFTVLDIAGFNASNTLGIYCYTEINGQPTIGTVLELFNGAAPLTSQTLQWNFSAGTVTVVGSNTTVQLGPMFGFYLTEHTNNTLRTYYTAPVLNSDRQDHAWLFDTRNGAVSELLGADTVIAFADNLGLGYDVILGISDVLPVAAPEPASLLLLGTGLVGVVAHRRGLLRRRARG